MGHVTNIKYFEKQPIARVVLASGKCNDGSDLHKELTVDIDVITNATFYVVRKNKVLNGIRHISLDTAINHYNML